MGCSDDCKSNRLEAEGFHVAAICYNGIDALKKIKEIRPALVLTDIKMPGMGGLELISKVHEAKMDVQFAIISGYNDFEYAKEAIGYGAIGYLLKPLDKKELLEVICRVRNQIARVENDQLEKVRMANELNNTLKYTRRHLFLDLLENKISKSDFAEYIEMLNEDEKKDAYQVIVVMAEKENVLDDLELRMGAAISDYVSDLIIQGEKIDEHYMVLLLGFSMQNASDMKNRIQRCFYAFRERQQSDLCLGFGSVITELRNAFVSYDTAMIAISYRLVYGWNKYFEFVETPDRNGLLSSICSTNAEIKIRTAFYELNKKQLLGIVDETIGKACLWAKKNPSILIESVLWLVSLCGNMITTMYDDTNAMKEMVRMNRQRIISSPTIEDLKQRVNAFLNECVDFKQQKVSLSKNQILMQTAKAFIDQNYMQDIGLNDVADAVHLNPNYFSTLFRDEIQMTFKAYLTQKRIEVAKKLLKNEQYRMNEIATLVGYNDAKQFSHVFKKTLGITPSEYRKIMVGHE